MKLKNLTFFVLFCLGFFCILLTKSTRVFTVRGCGTNWTAGHPPLLEKPSPSRALTMSFSILKVRCGTHKSQRKTCRKPMIRSVMMRSCDRKTLKSPTEGMNLSKEIMYTNINLSEVLCVRSHSCLLTSNSRVWTSVCALDMFYTQWSLPSHDTSTEVKALLIVLRGWNARACTNTALSCCLAGMVHRNCTADGWTHPLVPHEDACYTFNDTLLFIGEVSSGTSLSKNTGAGWPERSFSAKCRLQPHTSCPRNLIGWGKHCVQVRVLNASLEIKFLLNVINAASVHTWPVFVWWQMLCRVIKWSLCCLSVQPSGSHMYFSYVKTMYTVGYALSLIALTIAIAIFCLFRWD